MTQHCFKRQVLLAAPAREVFAWHERADAFEQLAPPWENIRLLSQSGPVSEAGSRVVLSIGLIPFLPWPRMQWVSEHQNYLPGQQFEDIQVKGPFAFWRHTHRVIPHGSGCILEDDITYALPLGVFGDVVAGPFIRWKLSRLFAFRHQRMQALFGAVVLDS